jgi:hypothetical protein
MWENCFFINSPEMIKRIVLTLKFHKKMEGSNRSIFIGIAGCRECGIGNMLLQQNNDMEKTKMMIAIRN